MITQSITELANHLPYLINQVELGECVIITQNGKSIAKIIPTNLIQEPIAPDWSAISTIRASLPIINESAANLVQQVREARY